ncbi:MAG: spore protease YyaC [Lachnospiraceae bacterium]|nr:spore protease YyaC [Lachnospiraceae bacterium]MBQ9935215.1 spore protease YyaC [Lachnospiraceae bacterium]
MNNVFSKNIYAQRCETEYFDIIDDLSQVTLGKKIVGHLVDSNIADYTPVILCIGTDRATGDCLGPLVGSELKHYHNRYIVIGDLKSPVHALNLKATLERIYKEINNPFIIAIDASLGATKHIGRITLSNCPIAPGKGVNKKLPAVGNISITGIVSMAGKSPSLLQSTRLYVVMKLASCISGALKFAIDYLEEQ